MRVTLEIDDALLNEALDASGASTKREVVKLGLKTLVRLSNQTELKKCRGKIEWEGDLESMRLDS